ncbi:MAG: zf-HC2 domain-containing protein [Gemmatimonadota bacterium]
MTDWIDRLSDYLDDDMSGDERAELEGALGGDVELQRVLEELREVRDTGASLPAHSPESNLWPGIESRIGTEAAVLDLKSASRARRRFSFTIPQLAAAAVAMLVLGSAGVWMAMNPDTGSPDGADPLTAVAPSPESGFVSLPPEEGPALSYEMAVRDLAEQLEIGRDRLDPSTIEALERSLATIDRAIAQAHEALEADPASVYLNRHLADAQTRKIRVLQQAARLVTS